MRHRLTSFRVVPVLVVAAVSHLVFLSGCGSTRSMPFSEYGAESVEVEDGIITVEIAGAETLDDRVATSPGRVVLVDFWATWCDSCLRQFPHTVQLNRFYSDDGLRVISVSLDEPTDQAEVLEFLVASHADFDNMISEYGASQESFTEFQIEDGAIPFYQLYDRWGQLRFTFTGEPVGLQDRIQELLEETQSPEKADEAPRNENAIWNPSAAGR